MTVGDKIHKLRTDKNWTQEDLGAKVGVNARHVNRWEKNRNLPTVRNLKKLATAFEIPYEELVRTDDLEGMFGDAELARQLQELQSLEPEDRAALGRVIQAFLMKTRMEKVLRAG